MADKSAQNEDPPSPDDFMSPAEMKPILARIRKGGSINFVVGVTKDKTGVILLDRRLAPKQLLGALRKQAAGLGLELEAPSLRFGTARVDEKDPKRVWFRVNKEAGGALRLKLISQIKRAGFSKLAIGGGEQ